MDAVRDFRTASTSTDFRELAGIAKRHCVDLPLGACGQLEGWAAGRSD